MNTPDTESGRGGSFIATSGKRKIVAEREGFEPSVPVSQYDGLANRWFKPLTHLSVALQR